MIKVQGALRVKKILQSKNGPFAVGTLSTDIGAFKVKEQVLDQFDEGSFQVWAWIAEISLSHYVAAGRLITEIRARLHDLQVVQEQADTEAIGEVLAEPDPLDELPPLKAPPAPQPARTSTSGESFDELRAALMNIGKGRKSVAPAIPEPSDASEPSVSAVQVTPAITEQAMPMPTPAPAEPIQMDDDASGDVQACFSEDLWVLIQTKQPIKLDATINRLRFREQSRLLREQLDYQFNSLEQTFYPATPANPAV